MEKLSAGDMVGSLIRLLHGGKLTPFYSACVQAINFEPKSI